jgi:3-keto-L-gulonate-6-phosphate decarboxylase
MMIPPVADLPLATTTTTTTTTPQQVRELRSQYPTLDIEVDGGLNEKTIATAAEVRLLAQRSNITCGGRLLTSPSLCVYVWWCRSKAGANVIVSGSGVFKAEDKKEAIEVLRRAVSKHIAN